MRSAIWAFMALFGILATLSLVQAAVPNTFITNPSIGDSYQGDTAVDAYGNSYYMRNDAGTSSNTIVAVSPDTFAVGSTPATPGVKFSGCPTPAVINGIIGGSTFLPNSQIAGFVAVADRSFPNSPSGNAASTTANILYVTICTATQCNLITVPLANAATATSGCPIVWASAANLGQIQGTWAAAAGPVVGACKPYASGLVSMAVNHATGAISVACSATFGSTTATFVFQTPNQNVASGAFSGLPVLTASNIAAFRVGGTTTQVGSMTIDTYGTLWAVDVARSTVFVKLQFTASNFLDTPNNIAGSTILGVAGVWSKSTSSNKYLGVTSDRSGNVYFSTTDLGGITGNVGYILSFPGIALLQTPSVQTIPRNWGYFSTGSFFDNAVSPAGSVVYDPYRGRLILNSLAGWYVMPLYQVTFDFTTQPTTLFQADGTTCGTESATCVRVPVMTTNQPTSFTLRIAAPTWPSAISSLGFAPNFIPSAAGVSTQYANPFPSTITATSFQSPAAPGTYAAIGSTGSNLFSWASGVTISSTNGFAGVIPVTPSFSGATNDVPFWFTALPSNNIVVQGSITATAVSSTAYPISSATLLAGYPTRYTLTLNPAPTGSCTNAAIRFDNSASHSYAVPVATSGSVTVNFNGNTASVTYTTQIVTPYPWVGSFTGTGAGCTQAYGIARVPFYALAFTTTAVPSISITPITTLISANPAVPAGFSVQMIPGPTSQLANAITITLTSGAASNPGSNAATNAPCTGDFSAATTSFTTSCNSGAPCTAASVNFIPSSNTCPLASAASAAVVATMTIPSGVTPSSGGSAYSYWNAASQTVTTVAAAGATISTYTITAPLSQRIRWNPTVGTFPAVQTVTPGGIIGPFTIDYAVNAAAASVTFTNSQNYPATYFVANAGGSLPNGAVFTNGPFSVAAGSLVWFRAPTTPTAAMLGNTNGIDIVIVPSGSAVAYDSSATPVSIFIRFVATLSTTSTPRQASSLTSYAAASVYMWGGTAGRTTNLVTLSWGSGTLSAGNTINIFASSSVTNNPVGFYPVGTTAFTVPTAITTLTPGTPNNANGLTACAAGCATISFPNLALNTSSVSFIVSGGLPGSYLTFYYSVTGSGTDSAFFNYNAAVPTARLFGQVFISSIPSSISVNVPTFFGVSVDPTPVPSTTMIVSDSASSNFGTFSFCADTSCSFPTPVAPAGGNTFDLNAFTGTLSSATAVLQYIPPAPVTSGCSGGLTNYPCALGTNPQFNIDLDPSFAFDWPANINSNLNVAPSSGGNRFKLTAGSMPALQGSIAITFLNYDAANDATNPSIGAGGLSTTYNYPLSHTAGASSIPVPMTSTGRPILNFLAGVRYVVGVTMFPPPPAGTSPQFTVTYNENNIAVPISQNFTYNRADAAAPAPVNGAPNLNTTLNIFPAASTDFVNNRLDGGLKDLTPTVTAFPSMCPSGPNGALDASGRCSVGFFWWTVPAVTSGAPANNPRLTFTVSGAGVTNYPSQNQTIKISGWCGPSANLRDSIAPTAYGIPTGISTVCTPALASTSFLNVYQQYTGVFSQPQFFSPASTFVVGTTTWTPPTGAGNDAGVFVAGNSLSSGALMQVFRVTGDASASLVATAAGTVAPAVLVYSVTSATGATRSAVDTALLPNYVQIRIISPITGTYTVRIANAAITTNCAVPALNYLVDATRLASVSSTSTNHGQVCFYPFRTGNGPIHTVTLSDGLGVTTNAFTASNLVTGGASGTLTPLPGGTAGPAVFTGAGTSTGGITGTMTAVSSVLAYDGFTFIWVLTSAATNIADFRICSGIATSAYVSNNLPPTAICATNAFPTLPVGPLTGVLPLSYRQFATAANSLAVTYGSNRVPISVTMKFTARGFGANDFSTSAVSSPPINFLVGETYAIELRTADSSTSPYGSPAVSGLTVTLNDLCGVLTYPPGGANPLPASSPVAVPARGQWSNTTLFFSPGETTKIVFYTPREICAPFGGTNYGTILTGTVSTDLVTSPDGNAVRFVNPLSVWVYTYGAVRVDNVPAYLPAGVATPSPVTVTLSPPLLAAGQTYGAIPTLTIPDVTVTVSDRAPSGTGIIGAGDASGGSFISGQNLGASATLAFSTTPGGNRGSASVTYVAPPSNFFLDSTLNPGVSRGLSFVLSGTGAPLYRIIAGTASSVYNGLATLPINPVVPSGADQSLFNVPTPTAVTFTLRIVAEASANTNPNVAAAPASIEGVYFNVIGGAALAQSTAASLATVSDNISQFVGNSNVLPGQANNAINFNLPFVSGVPFGYFAAVPFNISAVVVNVATTANTVFVNNNGWPNKQSVGGTVGGYVLPNALSGYVSPVFFLTPGLNTFLVAAPQGVTGDAFAFGSVAGSGSLNNQANGDGIVYRFTIARDTITNFGLFVSANGHAGLPWAANLPRLQPQYVAGSTASLLAVGPGSGTAQATFSVNVENAVQSVGILAQFYGSLKARVTSNVNEFGQILVNIPNNRLVDFPLVVPTNLPGVSAATTSITLLGGGLGPLTINVNRNGKGLNFGAQVFSAGSAVASNIVDGPNGPCIVRTATTFGLAVYPSSRPSLGGLFISGNYRIGTAAAVPFTQTVSPTAGWESASVPNYVSFATVAASIPTTSLPIIINVAANYPAGVVSEFTPLNNYALNLCPV